MSAYASHGREGPGPLPYMPKHIENDDNSGTSENPEGTGLSKIDEIDNDIEKDTDYVTSEDEDGMDVDDMNEDARAGDSGFTFDYPWRDTDEDDPDVPCTYDNQCCCEACEWEEEDNAYDVDLLDEFDFDRRLARAKELKRLEKLEELQPTALEDLREKMEAFALTTNANTKKRGRVLDDDDDEADNEPRKRHKDDKDDARMENLEEGKADPEAMDEDRSVSDSGESSNEMGDGEDSCASQGDSSDETGDGEDSCASQDDQEKKKPQRWTHVSDCTRLHPLSIRRIRKFFEDRPGFTRAMCHEHARTMTCELKDVTLIPAEAQFDGSYTIEVVSPNNDNGDQGSMMHLIQFRASGDTAGPFQKGLANVFGRYVPEGGRTGRDFPPPCGGARLSIWTLRCPRGRPLVCVASEMARQWKTNPRPFQGIMEDLAEMVTLPLLTPKKPEEEEERREQVWTAFLSEVMPELPSANLPDPTYDPFNEKAKVAAPKLLETSSMEEQFGGIFESSWPWTPFNRKLSDMSVLVKPDLSGIACVLEWRLSPMPFGANLSAAHSLLGTHFLRDPDTGKRDSGKRVEYEEDSADLWRFLLYSVRHRLGDIPYRNKLVAALRFGFAVDHVPKMASDRPSLQKALLQKAMTMFDLLQWEEEHFQFDSATVPAPAGEFDV